MYVDTDVTMAVLHELACAFVDRKVSSKTVHFNLSYAILAWLYDRSPDSTIGHAHLFLK